MKPDDVLARFVAALERAGIPYMLTGSLASSIYGSPRATVDIDIVIAPSQSQLRKLKDLLPETDYYFDLDDALDAFLQRTQFNVIDSSSMWKVDLIYRKDRDYDRTAFERRVSFDHEGKLVWVSTAEDSVISKLEWAKLGESETQLRDVAGILRARSKSLDFSYIARWVASLELKSQWDAAQKLAE
jgi:hypothetical protein